MNLRRLLGPSAIVLALGLGLATAQNITKSVQLSQDSTGQIGYDTSGGVYFPGHMLSTTSGLNPAPTVGATCGTTGQVVTGTDFNGQITVGGTNTTTCPLTFGVPYNSAPTCVVASASAILSSMSWVTAVTGLTITKVSGNSERLVYICSSLK